VYLALEAGWVANAVIGLSEVPSSDGMLADCHNFRPQWAEPELYRSGYQG
jgi:hypothetical protein